MLHIAVHAPAGRIRTTVATALSTPGYLRRSSCSTVRIAPSWSVTPETKMSASCRRVPAPLGKSASDICACGGVTLWVGVAHYITVCSGVLGAPPDGASSCISTSLGGWIDGIHA